MIFDLVYDVYCGVVIYVCMVDGSLLFCECIQMMLIGVNYEVFEVGVLSFELILIKGFGVGEVGYFIIGVKDVCQLKVGDMIMNVCKFVVEVFFGYMDLKFMVFLGIYLIDGSDYVELCEVFDKFKFFDVFLQYELEIFVVFGFGFCCGFFGLLYLEIVIECFVCEFGFDFIIMVLSVIYEVVILDIGEMVIVMNLSEYFDGCIGLVLELMVKVVILLFKDYVGIVMELCQFC